MIKRFLKEQLSLSHDMVIGGLLWRGVSGVLLLVALCLSGCETGNQIATGGPGDSAPEELEALAAPDAGAEAGTEAGPTAGGSRTRRPLEGGRKAQEERQNHAQRPRKHAGGSKERARSFRSPGHGSAPDIDILTRLNMNN